MTYIASFKSLLQAATLVASVGAFGQAGSNFVLTPSAVVGSAVLAPLLGGDYVYGPIKTDARIPSRAIIVSQPVRYDYVLFSAQEEEDLWSYKQNILNAEQIEIEKSRELRSIKKADTNIRSANWPKVVLSGESVCVPLVDFAGSKNWRDHLTCTPLEAGAGTSVLTKAIE
jgi:hypothetical protein